MRIRYRELVRLEFEHAYFESVRSAFTFRPQQATQRLLQRYGLLFRATRTGFTILYETIWNAIEEPDDTDRDDESAEAEGDEAEEPDAKRDPWVPRRRLPESFALRFWICPTSSYTGTVSALPAFNASRQTLYFDNLKERREGQACYLNAEAPAVKSAGEEDLVPLAPPVWRLLQAGTTPIAVKVKNARGTVVGSKICRPHHEEIHCRLNLWKFDAGRVSIRAGDEPEETYYRPESRPASAPLAAVDLYAGPFVPAACQFVDAGGRPRLKTFTCRIARQRSIWRYIIVPRFNATLQPGQLSIVDAEERYTFGAPETIKTLSGEDAFAIASEGPMPHQERPIKGLALRRNSTDLIAELPNPGPDQITVRKSGRAADVYVYV